MVRPWRDGEEDARIRARERERKSHKGRCTYRAYKWQCRLPDEVSCLCFSLVPPSPNDNPVRLCRVVEGVWCSFSSRRLALTPRHAEGGCHADPPRPRLLLRFAKREGSPPTTELIGRRLCRRRRCFSFLSSVIHARVDLSRRHDPDRAGEQRLRG